MEMPAYLIAGGRPRDPGTMIRQLSHALGQCKKEKPRVAYIGTANQDSEVFFEAMKLLILGAGAGEVKLLHLARENADVRSAKEFLQSSDAVFLSGGEVEDGINWLVRHHLTAFLKDLYAEGKLFIGVSAGSIMMGSHWVHWDVPEDNTTARLFDCLGFIPTVFDTHAEDENWVELITALTLLDPGAQGYGIPSGGMISANSQGRLVSLEKELLCFVNHGGQVQRIR